MNAPLQLFLESITPGEPAALGPITVVPLRRAVASAAVELALLDDDSARIGEVSEGGVVGRVKVESLTPLPLLLVAGEVLRGARQNRLVNASLLIEPGGELDVPVSCVERGRWAYRGGRGFRAAHVTVPWHMRSKSQSRSLRAKLRCGQHDAEQGTVWAEVDQHLQRKRASSRTSDLLAAMASELQDAVSDWAPADDDVGGAFFVGDTLVGLEAFGAPAAWRAASKRVLAGLCEEACGVETPEPTEGRGDVVTQLLERLQAMEVQSTPGEGLGTELQAEVEDTHLAALVADVGPEDASSVVHLRVARLPADARDATRDPVSQSSDRPPGPVRGRLRRQSRVRMRDLERALMRPCVSVGGPCLVVPIRDFSRLQRLGARLGGMPLPHRSGAGLAIWRSASTYPLLELGELLVDGGLPSSHVWCWNGDRDRLEYAPQWLEVVSVRRRRVELRRRCS